MITNRYIHTECIFKLICFGRFPKSYLPWKLLHTFDIRHHSKKGKEMDQCCSYIWMVLVVATCRTNKDLLLLLLEEHWRNTFKKIEKFRILLKSFTYSQARVPSSLIEAEQLTFEWKQFEYSTQMRELIEYNVETFQLLALLILVLGSLYICTQVWVDYSYLHLSLTKT